jgi:hypothetical protein
MSTDGAWTAEESGTPTAFITEGPTPVNCLSTVGEAGVVTGDSELVRFGDPLVSVTAMMTATTTMTAENTSITDERRNDETFVEVLRLPFGLANPRREPEARCRTPRSWATAPFEPGVVRRS